MRSRILAVSLVLTIAAIGGCATRPMIPQTKPSVEGATGFINKTMIVNGHERKYVLFVPPGYDRGKVWPLVVFLHGAGERGDDGMYQISVGIGNAIVRSPERFPCLVVMPQCPKNIGWDKAAEHVDAAISETQKNYNVDSRRIYLTGLSLGGYGAWTYGTMRPDLFAAIVPICGGGNPADAPKLAKVPIWAFHGLDDSIVKPSESRKMVEAVKAAGGNVQHTEYPGTNHNSWDKAYGDPDVIAWILKQVRR